MLIDSIYRCRNAGSPWCPLKAQAKTGVIRAFLGELHLARGAQGGGWGTVEYGLSLGTDPFLCSFPSCCPSSFTSAVGGGGPAQRQ